MQRPPSITLFALLFGISIALSLLLAGYAAQTATFGFPLTPAAAQTLARRILAIRLLGGGFALSLLLLVLFGRSRAARGALGVRWLLGLVTSVAFLRGIGMVVPGGSDMAAIVLSLVQVSTEGLAILLLYGEDAAPWFDRSFSR